MVLDLQGLYPEKMSPAQWHADLLDMHRRHFPYLTGGAIGYQADVLRLHIEHACAATEAIKTGDTSGLGAAKQTHLEALGLARGLLGQLFNKR